MDLDENKWIKIGIQMLLCSVLFFSVLIIFYVFLTVNYNKKNKTEQANFIKKYTQLEKAKTKIEETEKKKIEVSLNSLKARSVLVKDLSSQKVIFDKNQGYLLPIASLTKIMNAIVFIEKYQDKDVLMTKRALSSNGNYGISKYELFTKNDALRYMLVGSVNDIASAIALGKKDLSNHWLKFIYDMNQKKDELGLNSTLFFSENGLDVNSIILGSYSTTKDISKMIEYFYNTYPEISAQTVKQNISVCSQKKCHNVENTNLILKDYPEILFSKTGYTKKAGGVVSVIVEICNKKYSIVILGSTKQGRFDDLSKVINYLLFQL